jgi:hypothetical protein
MKIVSIWLVGVSLAKNKVSEMGDTNQPLDFKILS